MHNSTGMDLAELAKRVRVLAAALLLVFVSGMVAWFYPYDDDLDRSGTPLGGDYVMLYVAGQMVNEGAAERLYDEAAQLRRMAIVFPTADVNTCRLPFRYPPLVAILMAPLALLPYKFSFLVFTCLSLLAGGVACVELSRLVNPQGRDSLTRSWTEVALLATVSWPVVIETVAGGQLSLFGLAILASSVRQFLEGRTLHGGLLLGCACYKPNLLALAGFGLVLRYPRAAIGLVLTAGLALLLQLATVGTQPLLSYFDLARDLATRSWDLETPYWKVHGLASWIGLMAAGQERTLLLVSGLALTSGMVIRWRLSTKPMQAEGMIAILIVVNAIFNPYVPLYDLTLLAVPFFLLAGMLSRQRIATVSLPGQAIMLTFYFGPHLSQALCRATGLQLFPVLLAGFAVWLYCGVSSMTKRCVLGVATSP